MQFNLKVQTEHPVTIVHVSMNSMTHLFLYLKKDKRVQLKMIAWDHKAVIN